MPRWTAQQVAKAAPDEASLAAARRLAGPGPWTETGATDLLVWGKCQGSGKTPYQVSVDLVGPAYRCSCPSRKFPCKHALALLMLWVAGTVGGTVDTVDDPDETGKAPGFAQEWADERAGRVAKQQARAERRETPVDPAAAAKRQEERLALMDAGMEDFAVWLGDLVRQGLAAARQQPYAWWDATAARLVDAQLPGLADQVRAAGSDVHRRDDWTDHLLATCGRWWTATRAWSHRDTLDATQLADLRVAVGWAFSTAEVRAADEVRDRWLVLGAHRTDDGRVQQQRTWLHGQESSEVVQVLDFAAGGAALATPQLAGTVVEATVARYPGSAPRRALFREEPVRVDLAGKRPEPGDVDSALARAALRLGESPWSDRLPVSLAPVRVRAGTPGGVVDADGHWLELVADAALWPLLALTGGHPVELFGELEAGRLRPLSVIADDRLVAL